MGRLEKIKKVIEDNFVECGMFFTRNVVGDSMVNVYEEDGVKVDVCYDWSYFEVFGLTYEEKHELVGFYYDVLYKRYYEGLKEE